MKTVFNIIATWDTPEEYQKIWPTFTGPLAHGTFKIFNDYGDMIYMHDAVSGGWGNGYLPVGNYEIVNVIPSADQEYTRDGLGWYAIINPLFPTDRSGLLLHPVARREWPSSTLGCIGFPFIDLHDNQDCMDILKRYLANKLPLEVIKSC